MKKRLFILLLCLAPAFAFASGLFYDSFEYANTDMTVPTGWICNDQSWLCGHFDKDHYRTAHTGDWYAFSNTDDSWLFMEQYLSTQLRYRFSCWAISDGTYELQFWAGNGASAEQMNQLLFSVTVSGGQYENVSDYIETITGNYQFFGIHAVALENAYHLTIDDVNIDMVDKYSILSTPSRIDALLYPGEQIAFRFNVQNVGYEPFNVLIHPSDTYFTDIHFSANGSPTTGFHLEPDETMQVIAEATLRPNVEPGSECFLDVALDLDCSCASTTTTLWATVLNPDGIAEQEIEEGVQRVEVYDLTGKKIDPSSLRAGIYIEKTVSGGKVTTRKFIQR